MTSSNRILRDIKLISQPKLLVQNLYKELNPTLTKEFVERVQLKLGAKAIGRKIIKINNLLLRIAMLMM